LARGAPFRTLDRQDTVSTKEGDRSLVAPLRILALALKPNCFSVLLPACPIEQGTIVHLDGQTEAQIREEFPFNRNGEELVDEMRR
jgi:hypothetical protein